MVRVFVCILLFTSTVSATPSHLMYRTMDEAAIAALTAAETLTVDKEAGGTIYQCGYKFTYVLPITDNDEYRVSIPLNELIDKCNLVALYHTHPSGNRQPSMVDIGEACRLKLVGYIKPKGSEPFKYDCTRGKLT